MESQRRRAAIAVLRALLIATLLSSLFYGLRLWQLGTFAFGYLPWNLFLAWLPLLLTVAIVRYLRHHPWSDWAGLGLTLLWLLLLPNSFYLVSDYVHLQTVAPDNALYDSVMFTMFVFTGLLLGYTSLYVIHLELLRRMPVRLAGRTIGLILLACSVAIYVGRDLRWNSWDILTSPAGLLFDLSNRFVHPEEFRDMAGTVLLFFALLGSIYVVGWGLIRAARQIEPRDL